MIEPITEHHTVVRPTMIPTLKEPGNKGTEVIMVSTGFSPDPGPPPEPEFDDLAVADGKGSNWLGTNVYVVGETVEGKTAEFTGGKPPVNYRYRFQTQAEGSDSWVNQPWTTTTNAKNSVFFELVESGKVKFQSQARDANDPIVQLNSTAGTKTVTAPIVYDPLVVGDPVATGDAFVGYTLTCSEPSVDGGSGDTSIDYYWVDAATKAIVWESTYMGNTTTIIDYDLGKTMYCLVVVTDRVTGDSISKESNHKGPINRPALPEYETYVNSELYDDPSQQIGVLPGGSVVCEVRPETISNPPLDLAYEWKIRTGTGRLSGDVNGAGIIYLAPDSAPAGAALNCTVTSRDAANNAFAAEITILITE